MPSNRSKKKTEAHANESEENRINPELYLYSTLHRKYANRYRDPFLKGPQAMAAYIDAFMHFLQERYPNGNDGSRPTLNGLIATEISVNVGEGPEVNVTYDYRNGRTVIWIPKILGEKAQDELQRRIRVAQHAWPSLPVGIFEVLADLIRGMPHPSLDRMLSDYEKRFGTNERKKNGK